MRPSGMASFVSLVILLGSVACTVPSAATNPPATATLRLPAAATPSTSAPTVASPTAAPAGLATPTVAAPTAAPAASVTPVPQGFCSDGQVLALIDNFKSAVLTSNGPLLAALVSPTHGMEARLFRNGRTVTYDAEHAKFVFVSEFVVDWGLAPASGLDTQGSFHELMLPALVDVFGRTYTLVCDQVKVGGASYNATWPYPAIHFYSVYYPGTAANGNMDWHTWLIGVHEVAGKPYIYAIMQFQWEP